MGQGRVGCAGTLLTVWLAICAAVAGLDGTSANSTWLALAVGGVVLYALFKIQRAGRNSSPGAVGILRNYPGEFAFEVVGESHYQDNLEAICGRRSEDGAQRQVKALLVPEDDNPKDGQAVRVDVEGKTVGYLPRDLAPGWRRVALGAGVPHGVPVEVPAEIRGGWDRGPEDRGHFGIWLDLPIASE